MLSQFLSQINLRTRPKCIKSVDELAGYIHYGHSEGLGQWRVGEKLEGLPKRGSTIPPASGTNPGSSLYLILTLLEESIKPVPFLSKFSYIFYILNFQFESHQNTLAHTTF